jgi:hypothetical protein
MEKISFSGRAAFSYVWKKNSDGVQLSRLLTAIGAACIGFVCGYKVKTTDLLYILYHFPYLLFECYDYLVLSFFVCILEQNIHYLPV